MTGARETSNGGNDTIQRIAHAIESYLGAHHDAADSAEGIRSFWLPTPLRAEPLDRVIAALEDLESRRVVVRRDVDGVGPVYSRPKR